MYLLANKTANVPNNQLKLAIVYRHMINLKPVNTFWNFISPEYHHVFGFFCLLNELEKHKLTDNAKQAIA